MEIEEVKTWQWMLAGLIAGFAFSCVVVWSGPAFDTQPRDTIEQGEFENAVISLTKFGSLPRMAASWHKDKPMLRDVTVHPPLAGDAEHSYWVTGRSYFVGLRPVDPLKVIGPKIVYEEWRPFKYAAAAPYLPGYTVRENKKLVENPFRMRQLEALKQALGGQKTFPTVIDFLKAVSAIPEAQLHYQYAWWELPKVRWILPPVAGFSMIGVAWPLALSVLQHFGMSKPTPVKVITALSRPLRLRAVLCGRRHPSWLPRRRLCPSPYRMLENTAASSILW